MIRKALPRVLALAALAASYWAYSEIRLLRGTIFWEFRLIVLLIAVILALSLLESLLAKLLPAPEDHSDDA